MLYQLRDGCCCATVLAEAGVDQIASLFGSPEGISEEDSVEDAELVVSEITGTPWAMVYFSYNSKIEEREGDIDSDPLIRQARSAIVGEVPKAPIGYTSSVTCAAKISTALRCRAIGIWASDQGDGIGGGALLQNGSIIECHSAAGVKELDAIKKIRELEDDEDEEVDRLIDQLEEACEGKYWHFKDGSTRAVNGEIDDVFTVYLASFGLDSEICLEVYDDIISGNCPDSVTRVVHSISRDL